jgi:hypothetical protein
MASQFENAGLGMFGREGQFSRGGPINELVKLVPALGAVYGLVKSGAVDKLNADNWLSNPRKAMADAVLGGSAPPVGSGEAGIKPSGMESISTPAASSGLDSVKPAIFPSYIKDWDPDAVNTDPAMVDSANTHQLNLDAANQTFPTGDDASGNVENSSAIPSQATTIDPATTAPIRAPLPIDQRSTSELINTSSVTPNKLTADRSQDAAALQAQYTPSPRAVQSVGQGDGGGGGGSAISTFLTLAKLFA